MRLSSAIRFIKDKHAGQFDKGGLDYFLHPISVMRRLPPGSDESTKMVALGHDLKEDTDATDEEMIEAGWTIDEIDSIKLLSRDKSDGRTYIQWIHHIVSSGDERAMRVKLADNEDNCDEKRVAQLPVEQRSIVDRYKRSMEVLKLGLAALEKNG